MYGKKGGDTMYGRAGMDGVYGNPGPDKMFGGVAGDRMEGGPGVDRIYGNEGGEDIFTGVRVDLKGRDSGSSLVGNSDFSDDYVYGGRGPDHIVAGGERGVDRLFGDRGKDNVRVEDNSTKEIVDCGPDTDTVFFDEGVDVIKNCEIKNPF
jgi:Ca2+-binding RTX toxin-like protein